MIVLKQSFLNDRTKSSKKFFKNGTKTVQKGSLIMVLKTFHSNGAKKIP